MISARFRKKSVSEPKIFLKNLKIFFEKFWKIWKKLKIFFLKKISKIQKIWKIFFQKFRKFGPVFGDLVKLFFSKIRKFGKYFSRKSVPKTHLGGDRSNSRGADPSLGSAVLAIGRPVAVLHQAVSTLWVGRRPRDVSEKYSSVSQDLVVKITNI